MERVTIREVADKAGVTIGTISNYINGSARVSTKTAEKIKKAIIELNYVPNEAAKRLRSKSSKIIGVLIPNLKNSFYTNAVSTFADKAFEHGYSVQLIAYEYSVKRELQGLKKIESDQAELLLLFNGFSDEKELYNLAKRGTKVILVERDSTLDNVSTVQFENRQIFCDIISMLKEKGIVNIGYVSEKLILTNVKNRYLGYIDALKKYELDFNEKNIFIDESLCLNSLKNGYEYMKKILEKYSIENIPRAWIASSDLLAIGIIRALHDYGYEVPNEFKVIGFDNTEIADYVSPRLTTVNQDQVLLGNTLWEVANQLLANTSTSRKVLLKQQLVMRESC